MIERKNLFSIPFYKKTFFTGTWQGMHYKIERKEESSTEENGEEKKETYFLVTVWPGPYCYDKTREDVKYHERFQFSTEGLDEICDWLNQQYEEKEETWKQVTMWQKS